MRKFNFNYCMKQSICKWCKYEKKCEQFLNNEKTSKKNSNLKENCNRNVQKEKSHIGKKRT